MSLLRYEIENDLESGIAYWIREEFEFFPGFVEGSVYVLLPSSFEFGHFRIS